MWLNGKGTGFDERGSMVRELDLIVRGSMVKSLDSMIIDKLLRKML